MDPIDLIYRRRRELTEFMIDIRNRRPMLYSDGRTRVPSLNRLLFCLREFKRTAEQIRFLEGSRQ